MLRLPINGIDYSYTGKLAAKMGRTGQQMNQSTSLITDELLHDSNVRNNSIQLIRKAIESGVSSPKLTADLLFESLRSRLKPQLVFRILYALDYARRV